MSIQSLDDITRARAELKEGELKGEVVELVARLLKAHIDLKQAALKQLDRAEIPAAELKEKAEAGEKIADLAKLKINGDFVARSFSEVCDIESEYAKQNRDEIAKLKQAIAAGEVDLAAVQEAVVCGGDGFSSLQKGLKVSPELLLSLSLNVFRPIFEAFLQDSYEEIRELMWSTGKCPACDSYPAMSRLERETGTRYYWCTLCNTQWKDKRIKCPFCGTEEQKKLDFFFIEDGSPYRADVCRECKGYVKTIDEKKRKSQEPILFLVEDIKTAHLDVLAAKEGFSKKLLDKWFNQGGGR